MKRCMYCGKRVGFFRKAHKECEKVYQEKKAYLDHLFLSFAKGEISSSEFLSKVEYLFSSFPFSKSLFGEMFFLSFEKALSYWLKDGILDEREKDLFFFLSDKFGLSLSPSHPVHKEFLKAYVLGELSLGKIPQVELREELPFFLSSDERILWIFSEVELYKRKKKREYRGGYQGFSIRLLPGLYYRIGGYRGKPVEKEVITLVDKGLWVFTTMHMYFKGEKEVEKISYKKVFFFFFYSDGIVLFLKIRKVKEYVFLVEDPLFVKRLIEGIKSWEA